METKTTLILTVSRMRNTFTECSVRGEANRDRGPSKKKARMLKGG
jgi:hypothetical protein